MRFEFPDGAVWATPGGGVHEGESDEQALRRELAEEAGLESFELGPLLWTRTHVTPFGSGRWDGQRERFYLVRVPAFDPAPRLSWEELRREGVSEVRWWTPSELAAGEALFAPRRLPELVRALARDGPPPAPLEVGT